jgi:molybdopterin molybdotransferase
MTLLTVKAAQRRIRELVAPVSTEIVPLARGLGRVLANDVKAIDLPPFDNSSVDGFAVRSEDLRSASPQHPSRLAVVGDVSAGSVPAVRVSRGQAVRIMTGAMLPRGADAVIMLEDTDYARARQGSRPPSLVTAFAHARAGKNVRRRGSDVRAGRVALRAGKVLRPQEIGLLAMLGKPTIRVYRRPVIAILSSGNELVPAGHAPRPGAVRDTNSATLTGLAANAGCEVIQLGIARDSMRAIEAHLRPAVRGHADLIITSAGVSVGAFDLVRDVVRSQGRLLFWRVNVRPGKPLAVGEYRGIPLIGLPGNPVSAFVGFELFARPAIERLGGHRDVHRPRIRATLTEPVTSDGRQSYLRATLREESGVNRIVLTGHQGSGNLLSLVESNALLVVPAGVKSLAVGDEVDVWLL